MIYLSGSCSSEHRTLMQGISKSLRESGYEVYCPFEYKVEDAWNYSQEDWADLVFMEDIKALDKCSVFLLISPGRNSTAGSNFEQGYAYAKGKTVIVVQYTKNNTSIMTYSGCHVFKNSNLDNINKDVVEIMSCLHKYVYTTDSIKCDTTLV